MLVLEVVMHTDELVPIKWLDHISYKEIYTYFIVIIDINIG